MKDLADQINQQYDNIKVILPGYRADAASFMVMFDVFVMPSRYEGYGLALTEAMSLGLPVVCHKIDSLPELCQLYRGHSFLFEMRENDPQFEQQNAAAMADAVIAAADCPRTDGQVLMTGDGMVMEYLQIYEKICQKN